MRMAACRASNEFKIESTAYESDPKIAGKALSRKCDSPLINCPGFQLKSLRARRQFRCNPDSTPWSRRSRGSTSPPTRIQHDDAKAQAHPYTPDRIVDRKAPAEWLITVEHKGAVPCRLDFGGRDGERRRKGHCPSATRSCSTWARGEAESKVHAYRDGGTGLVSSAASQIVWRLLGQPPQFGHALMGNVSNSARICAWVNPVHAYETPSPQVADSPHCMSQCSQMTSSKCTLKYRPFRTSKGTRTHLSPIFRGTFELRGLKFSRATQPVLNPFTQRDLRALQNSNGTDLLPLRLGGQYEVLPVEQLVVIVAAGVFHGVHLTSIRPGDPYSANEPRQVQRHVAPPVR